MILDVNEDGSIDAEEFSTWYDAVQTSIRELNDAGQARDIAEALRDAINHAYDSYYPLTDHPALNDAMESLSSLGGRPVTSSPRPAAWL